MANNDCTDPDRAPLVLRIITTVESVLILILTFHVVLVCAGLIMQLGKTDYPSCKKDDASELYCVMTNRWLFELAELHHESMWRVIADNPTIPLFWPITYGTPVFVRLPVRF